MKGKIIFKVDEMLKKRNIARYRIHVLTEIPYSTILKYCRNQVQRIPVEHLALFCEYLDCDVSDLIEYREEKK